MKLIIQIPCYNEEGTLSIALSALPRELPGIDEVEWLIINDGSTDRTVEVAKENGVDHIVSFPTNRGLAKVFIAGIDACLERGADIIVNTDADNQYNAEDIPKLIRPILEGKADYVVGARPIMEIKHFSPIKKLLQRLGSWAVRIASGTDIPDSPSGFRAISREAALQLNVFNPYTYTLETIIQAGRKNIAITSVSIRTNEDLRPSRLVKSLWSYVRRSMLTILRIFMVYEPAKVFGWIGALPFSLGVLLMVRWLFYTLWLTPDRVRAPSLILAAILVLIGVQLWIFAMIANLISTNRSLLENIQLRTHRLELAIPAGKTDFEGSDKQHAHTETSESMSGSDKVASELDLDQSSSTAKASDVT
jgi:glycosyltransferase involved in cell wall biosynthesis